MNHTLRKRSDRALVAVLLMSAVAGPAWADETAFDFRGGKLDESVFGETGPNWNEYVKAEERGLSIRILPPAGAPTQAVGIHWACSASKAGDFAVTVRYEIS